MRAAGNGSHMTDTVLPGRLGKVRMDGELPNREDLGLVFDELDYQLATQAYLWALPLVSFTQWRQQHREVFGATSYDLVQYLSYQDRLGIITANATTAYIMTFIDLSETGPVVIEVPAGPTAGGLSATRLISPASRPWSGVQPRGLDYWVRLHDIYQDEIVDERDRFYLAMLRQLGIEKGKEFAPDDRLTSILAQASASGELMAQAAMKSQIPGKGQAYLSCYTDADGEWLDGGSSYAGTRCLIDNKQQRSDRGSRDRDLRHNDDGSVDLYFGPSVPAGLDTNWVQTMPGRHWFSYFRFYGPLEPYFDRTWKLGDIERAQ
jgi:hypothetical protein